MPQVFSWHPFCFPLLVGQARVCVEREARDWFAILMPNEVNHVRSATLTEKRRILRSEVVFFVTNDVGTIDANRREEIAIHIHTPQLHRLNVRNALDSLTTLDSDRALCSDCLTCDHS